MNIPDDLHYTDHDEWIRVEGNQLVVGISDFAQDQLGELVHVELPEVGTAATAGEVVCEIESVKAVAEIYAPASGTIVAVNKTLDDTPERLNTEPYAAWIYKIEVSATPEGLLDAEQYKAKVAP